MAYWHCRKILHPHFIHLELGFNLKISRAGNKTEFSVAERFGLHFSHWAPQLGNTEAQNRCSPHKGLLLCSQHTATTSAGQFLWGEQIRAGYQRERRSPVRSGGRRTSIFSLSLYLSFSSSSPLLFPSFSCFQKVFSYQDDANKRPLITPVKAIFGSSKMRKWDQRIQSLEAAHWDSGCWRWTDSSMVCLSWFKERKESTAMTEIHQKSQSKDNRCSTRRLGFLAETLGSWHLCLHVWSASFSRP